MARKVCQNSLGTPRQSRIQRKCEDFFTKVKGLDVEKLIIGHVQVNQAQKGRRRTYRAHGRINPYLNHPCHIEIWAVEKDEDVKREAPKSGVVAKLTKKQLAKNKLSIGA